MITSGLRNFDDDLTRREPAKKAPTSGAFLGGRPATERLSEPERTPILAILATLDAPIAASDLARDEMFITTKLSVEDQGEEKARRAFEASLGRLGLDYVEPVSHPPTVRRLVRLGACDGETQQRRPRTRDRRVELLPRFVDLIEHNEIAPAINQVEFHPFFQRADYQELMRERGVQIESWRPFAEGRNNLFSDPMLTEIGAAHGKSVAQVVLRWLIQRGVVVVQKSVRAERIRENFDVFDFKLTNDEMIAAVDRDESLFFDHHDPAIASQFANRRLD